MIINKQNTEDIKRYYKGTFVKFRETGDHVWRICGVTENDLLAADDKGEEIAIDLNLDYNIEYVIPGKCAFQFESFGCTLNRIPAKQYFRGMHPENTKFTVLKSDGRWATANLGFSTIQGFVNKPIYTQMGDVFNEIKNQLDPNIQSWAISPNFLVARNGMLFTNSGTSIGKIFWDRKKIKVSPLFKPEMKALGIYNHFDEVKTK